MVEHPLLNIVGSQPSQLDQLTVHTAVRPFLLYALSLPLVRGVSIEYHTFRWGHFHVVGEKEQLTQWKCKLLCQYNTRLAFH